MIVVAVIIDIIIIIIIIMYINFVRITDRCMALHFCWSASNFYCATPFKPDVICVNIILCVNVTVLSGVYFFMEAAKLLKTKFVVLNNRVKTISKQPIVIIDLKSDFWRLFQRFWSHTILQ